MAHLGTNALDWRVETTPRVGPRTKEREVWEPQARKGGDHNGRMTRESPK